jgi:hypothetical protein
MATSPRSAASKIPGDGKPYTIGMVTFDRHSGQAGAFLNLRRAFAFIISAPRNDPILVTPSVTGGRDTRLLEG